MSNHLKPFWQKRFQFNARFGLFLLLIICIPRFLLVLNANQTGNYGPIGVIMVVSALGLFPALGPPVGSGYVWRQPGLLPDEKVVGLPVGSDLLPRGV